MSLLIILSFLTLSTFAQNDQVITTRLSVLDPLFLQTTASIVFTEELPLRIETPQNVADEAVSALQTGDPFDPLNPIIIEVVHPGILDKFYNLVSLSLWRVGLRRIGENSFRNCSSLTGLFLDANFIEKVPENVFRNCENLIILNLRSNLISEIIPETFNGLRNLQTLYLEGNRISTINPELFVNFPSLSIIALSSNPLQTLTPGTFPTQLRTLELSNCSLTELHPELFKNLTSLTWFRLDRNPITQLPPGIFSDLSNLQFFFISQTNIRRLNRNSFGLHPQMALFSLVDSAFDELQPGFFDNFPNLIEFDSRRNRCADVRVQNVSYIDFNEDPVLNRCFANWFVPRP